MKWAWKVVGVGAMVVTIVGAVRMGDDLLAWYGLFSGWAQSLQKPVADLLYALWPVIFVISFAITTMMVLVLAVRIVAYYASALLYAWLRLKGVFQMSDHVGVDEARQIIRDSDFVRSRLPSAKASSEMERLVAAVSFKGESVREKMVLRSFLRQILQAFKEQRPESVKDDEYNRDDLRRWLDELFDIEVEQEMGAIPSI